MNIKITKDQLRQVNAMAGKVNADSGKLFTGVRGALNQGDSLYHVEVVERDLAADEAIPDSFSLSQLLGIGSESPVVAAEPVPAPIVEPSPEVAAEPAAQ